MATERSATATWQGDLTSGSGEIDKAPSGAFGPLPVTWTSRTEQPNGKTSPEELLAAAHAACFSMALANGLAQSGNAPETLRTSATVTFVPGTGVTKSELTVVGSVPGLDEDAFRVAAEDAKENCPISKALGGVEKTLDAKLG